MSRRRMNRGFALASVVGLVGLAACGAGEADRPPAPRSLDGGSAGIPVSPAGGDAGWSGMPADASGGGGNTGVGGTASERICYDGQDDDRDGLADCADSDCQDSCESSCASPIELEDPTFLRGSTAARRDEIRTSCGGDAPEAVFALVASSSGVLDVELGGDDSGRIAIRDGCGEGEELACGRGRLQVPVVAGDRLVLVVESADEQGVNFSLDVRSRDPQCGDSVLDPGEQCDDGNRVGGDGCDPECALVSSEGPDNDAPATADSYPESGLYYGSIDPAGDVDSVSVSVGSPGTRVVADTFDFGDGACDANRLDSTLELLAPDGVAMLAADDDGGAGACAHLVSPPLEAGTYALRVSASSAGATPTFPYVLSIRTSACGDGFASEGESCDDGNTAAGDGCSPTCLLE